ncbi:hypothetical protein MRB53_037120 [Persea americana]|nr:hypothetical protein MRB53_037120 [Persea americana]
MRTAWKHSRKAKVCQATSKMATYATHSTGSTNGIAPKIKFYTNHGCPWAHRAQITLKELGLPYEEVIIPLDKPREQWYLDINPRGLVPTIEYSAGPLDKEIIYESAIVSQFLADIRPSHLLPGSNSSPTAALNRAHLAFFVDTFMTKVNSNTYPMLLASDDEKEQKTKAYTAAIEKDIEPLLKDAKPFFAGSEQLTFAETQVAPFLLRLRSYIKGNFIDASVGEKLEALPNFSKWWSAITNHPSITFNFEEETFIENTGKRLAKLKAEKAEKAKV